VRGAPRRDQGQGGLGEHVIFKVTHADRPGANCVPKDVRQMEKGKGEVSTLAKFP